MRATRLQDAACGRFRSAGPSARRWIARALLVTALAATAPGAVDVPAARADAAAPSPPGAAVAAARAAAKQRRRAPVPTGPDGRFRDNGDGTVTDSLTHLMWEKKSDDGSLHDKDLEIVWWPRGDAMTVTQWLEALNGENKLGFAQHRDWRLPTRNDLLGLVDSTRVDPAVYGAFNDACTPGCDVITCSCTASAFYWSPSPHHTGVAAQPTPDPASGLPRLELTLPPRAWHVHFHTGWVLVADETQSSFRARAVRPAD